MRATAIALLGYTDDAEDAVQEALLLAMQRLGQLRDPSAAGAWLKAIVRNECRAQIRSRRETPARESDLASAVDPEADPQERLERLATGDWVHHGLASLSGPIREVMLLRYFSDASSYRQIGQLCGIDPQTVGSRLRERRRTLARCLADSAGQTHDEAAREAAVWRQASVQLADSMTAGTFGRVLDDWYHPDAAIVVMGMLNGERELLLDMLEWTFSADVQVRLHNTTASRDVLLWEADFINPPSDPEHCPPTMAAI